MHKKHHKKATLGAKTLLILAFIKNIALQIFFLG